MIAAMKHRTALLGFITQLPLLPHLWSTIRKQMMIGCLPHHN
jgi:hypothetical protein